MSPLDLAGLSVIAVMLLMAMRMPIAISLALVSVLGIAQLRGFDVAFGLIKSVPHDFTARWELSAVPMFLLMGAIAHNTGISSALFVAARLWMGGLPGGLAVAANLASAGFAAASGSSVATAAAMGRIAIPEMIKHGYDKALATGTVASAGTLGALIPPSIAFILFGVFAEVSITKLLIAGILPGLLTAAVYAAMIITRCKLNPALAPPLKEKATRSERMQALGAVWPILVLILAIIGGLYAGIVTPTEAGAFGAFMAFVISFVQGRLSLQTVIVSLRESVASTARIFIVAVGAVLFTKFLALTGTSFFLGSLVGSWALDPILLIVAATVIYLVLGMFLDPIGVLLLTLPILLPMFEALNMDLIWVGVILVKYIEIGLLTPPVGFNVYVIKSVVGDEIPLETIFKGVTWFLVCEVFIVILLVAFPQISLFLPNTL